MHIAAQHMLHSTDKSLHSTAIDDINPANEVNSSRSTVNEPD